MSAQLNPRFDPTTLEVLWTRLRSVTDEAAKVIVRTSFSTLSKKQIPTFKPRSLGTPPCPCDASAAANPPKPPSLPP